jgi:hypothetical protein
VVGFGYQHRNVGQLAVSVFLQETGVQELVLG